MSSPKEIYVGLDVGRESMEAVWVDKEGKRMDSLSFPNENSGYEEFLQKLEKLREKDNTIIVGAEGHAGDLSPLDQYLNEEGFQFLSIQPLKVRRYKDILGHFYQGSQVRRLY